MKTAQYFPSSLIAQVAKCHLRTIKRHAAKRGWPRQLRGNVWQFVPPDDLQSKCLEASRVVTSNGMDGFAIDASHKSGIIPGEPEICCIVRIASGHYDNTD
jgi:hypothetical protein